MGFKVGDTVKIKKLSQHVYDEKGYDENDGIHFIEHIFIKNPKNEWKVVEKWEDSYTLENVYSAKQEELELFEIEQFQRDFKLPDHLFEL